MIKNNYIENLNPTIKFMEKEEHESEADQLEEDKNSDDDDQCVIRR